jgi:hypothetical protein
MDLLPVTADYDQISERMRQVAASTYMELIEGMRPHVREALSDPAGIHDTEPGRLQAYTAMVKLQATLIKELGLLYRVQDRPREDVQEESMPLREVQLLLDEAQRREDAAVAAAAQLAEARTRAELVQREVIDLAVARDRVARGLKALGR